MVGFLGSTLGLSHVENGAPRRRVCRAIPAKGPEYLLQQGTKPPCLQEAANAGTPAAIVRSSTTGKGDPTDPALPSEMRAPSPTVSTVGDPGTAPDQPLRQYPPKGLSANRAPLSVGAKERLRPGVGLRGSGEAVTDVPGSFRSHSAVWQTLNPRLSRRGDDRPLHGEPGPGKVGGIGVAGL